MSPYSTVAIVRQGNTVRRVLWSFLALFHGRCDDVSDEWLQKSCSFQEFEGKTIHQPMTRKPVFTWSKRKHLAVIFKENVKLKLLAAVAAISLFSFANAGLAQTYDCTVKDDGSNWIPKRVIFSIDEKAGKALVLDGIIHNQFQRPIAAKFSRHSEKSIRLDWEIRNLDVGNVNMKEHVSYTLTMNQRTLVVVEKAFLHFFDNRPRAQGKCKIIKNSLFK
ncbi:hypothetical protein ACXYMO_03545 [Arenibacterium sp. CAU 1754]